MTISNAVQRQFYRSPDSDSEELIRIPPTVIMCHNVPRQVRQAPIIKTKHRLNIWTVEEHDRFLVGLEKFPKGPWKAIAAVVGTKTTRQTMSHSQKYREKIKRMSARRNEGETTYISDQASESDSEAPPLSEQAIKERADSQWNDMVGAWSVGVDWEIESLLRELDIPLHECVVAF